MVTFIDLWAPILLSAVIAFVASSIIWMATPIHKKDYKNPGDKEAPLLDAIRAASLRPGLYFVPWCQGKPKDEMARLMKSEHWALISILPGAPSMGRMLGLWFLHLLIASALVALALSFSSITAGAPYMSVFRITGVIALLAHASGAAPACIWNGQPWSSLPGRIFDGVVYALLTAGTFAWLWPNAAA
ncbi:MAG: hypothetical protein RBS39_06820 [Phycisphaerales bacterium]|jgi:hypothetical protein|nr:hypothetical protein [Phycisphaerales bacterium]